MPRQPAARSYGHVCGFRLRRLKQVERHLGSSQACLKFAHAAVAQNACIIVQFISRKPETRKNPSRVRTDQYRFLSSEAPPNASSGVLGSSSSSIGVGGPPPAAALLPDVLSFFKPADSRAEFAGVCLPLSDAPRRGVLVPLGRLEPASRLSSKKRRRKRWACGSFGAKASSKRERKLSVKSDGRWS